MSGVRIILVDTSHPGNIGAAARAMKTMGLTDLSLVTPHAFPSAQATARATGADDVLDAARVFPSLSEAIAECNLVIGSSARARHIDWPQMTVREAGNLAAHRATHASVAFVFGRERTGLTNAELDHCHCLAYIPTHSGYHSLNLAAAVQVVAYEVHMANQTLCEASTLASVQIPAPAIEMDRLYEHLEQTLTEVDFLNPAHPRLLMRRLRRLFNRAQPDAVEVNILRGILTAVQRSKRC